MKEEDDDDLYSDLINTDEELDLFGEETDDIEDAELENVTLDNFNELNFND